MSSYPNPPQIIGTSDDPGRIPGGKTVKDLNCYDIMVSQKTLHQKRWQDAESDASFMSSVYGGQLVESKTPLPAKSRFTVQQIKTVVDAVSGYQVENRRAFRILTTNGVRDRAADQQNTVQKGMMRAGRMLNTFSDAFKHAVVTGSAFIEPLGMKNTIAGSFPDFHMWPCWNTSFDTNGMKEDGSDWEYFATSHYESKAAVKRRFPGIPKGILDTTQFAFMSAFPLTYRPPDNPAELMYLAQISRVWHREEAIQSAYVGTSTGRILPAERTDLLDDQEFWELVEVPINGWKLSTYVNGFLVKEEFSPFGETPPFIPIFWDFFPSALISDQKYTSLVRTIKDSAFVADWILNLCCDALQGRQNGGFIFERGSVDEKDINSTNNIGNIGVAKGANPPIPLSMSIFPVENLQAIEQLQLLLSKSAPVSYVAPELQRGDSGEKIALQQGIQVRGLASYLARLDESLINMGVLSVLHTTLNLSVEEATKAVGEPLDPYFWCVGRDSFEFESAPGLFTDTQRQQVYASAMSMFKEWGRPPSTAVMKEICTIPEKEKIFAILEEEDKRQGEFHKLQAELADIKMKAEIERTKAESLALMFRTKESEARAKDISALGVEHETRSEQNLSASVKNYADAAKTLAEIESFIGNSNLEKLIEEARKMSQDLRDQKEEATAVDLGANKAIESLEEDIWRG